MTDEMRGRPRKDLSAFADLAAETPSDVLSFSEWQRRVCLRIVAVVGTPAYSRTFFKEVRAIVKVTQKLVDPALLAEAADLLDSSTVDPSGPQPENPAESWIWQLWRLRDDMVALLRGERPIQNQDSVNLREAVLTACYADPPHERYIAEESLRAERSYGGGGPAVTKAKRRRGLRVVK